MKKILITGNDGSGKSFIISRLSEILQQSNSTVIHLPHSANLFFPNDALLTDSCRFVYELSVSADKENDAQLKAFALFSSMLLFERVLLTQIEQTPENVFFERHPLIDISVYAKFYASKLLLSTLDSIKCKIISEKYEREVGFILKPVSQYIDNEKNRVESFLNFLYKRFHIEQKNDFESVQELFPISLPEVIYFLRARSEFLFERISKRNFREPHESVQVFSLLDSAYCNLFETFRQTQVAEVQIVNAENSNDIQALIQKLSNNA